MVRLEGLCFEGRDTIRLSDKSGTFRRGENVKVYTARPEACVSEASLMKHLGGRIRWTCCQETPEDG